MMQNPNQYQSSQQTTQQQLAAILRALSQSPLVNPTSPMFNSSLYQQLYALSQPPVQPQPPAQTPPPQPLIDQAQTSSPCNYAVIKLADDPKMIEPQDVPMGTRSLFPSSDGEKIFMRAWNNEGLIETDIYVRQPRSKSTDRAKKPESKESTELSERIVALEQAILKIQKQLTRAPSRRKQSNKKEEVAENQNEHQPKEDPQYNYDGYVDIYEEVSVNE